MPLPDREPPFGTVVFDCDSTLSAIEGIEELARENAEVAELTAQAMDGRLPLEQVFARRLELVRPSRADVERIGRRYVEHLVPHADRLIAALQGLGKRVVIVSGGLLPAVRHLARHLGVPDEDVHAVDLQHDESGAYAGFDEASPLARSGGKPAVLEALRRDGERLALVGDGATDLEAAPLVDRFVAFAGVERRAAVLAAARRRCLEPDFRALVPLLLSAEEIATLSAEPGQRAWLALPDTGRPPTA
jgi:phosphoserine phosphatase